MFEAKYIFIFLVLCQFNFSLALVERNIRISGEQFILTKTNEPIVMIGPNVVVKGNPVYRLFIYQAVAIYLHLGSTHTGILEYLKIEI